MFQKRNQGTWELQRKLPRGGDHYADGEGVQYYVEEGETACTVKGEGQGTATWHMWQRVAWVKQVRFWWEQCLPIENEPDYGCIWKPSVWAWIWCSDQLRAICLSLWGRGMKVGREWRRPCYGKVLLCATAFSLCFYLKLSYPNGMGDLKYLVGTSQEPVAGLQAQIDEPCSWV